MYKTDLNPVIISISLFALFGILAHVNQLGNIAMLSSEKLDDNIISHISSKVAEVPKDTHLDLASFSSGADSIKSHAQTARAREDDENDQKANKRSIKAISNNNRRINII